MKEILSAETLLEQPRKWNRSLIEMRVQRFVVTEPFSIARQKLIRLRSKLHSRMKRELSKAEQEANEAHGRYVRFDRLLTDYNAEKETQRRKWFFRNDARLKTLERDISLLMGQDFFPIMGLPDRRVRFVEQADRR